MKETQKFSAWLIRQVLVFGALLVVAGCATNGSLRTDETLPAQVARLKGGARWSNDDGRTWRTIKTDSKLPPGALVQTAGDSHVDIGLGDSTSATAYRLYLTPSPVEVHTPDSTSFPRRSDQGNRERLNPVGVPSNVIRVWENSRLNLDRLKWRLTKNGTHMVEEGQFDLRVGHVFIRLTKLAGDSLYEIKYPNGVIRIGNGVYDLSAEGIVKVVHGRALVTWPGSPTPQVVLSYQEFDTRTGVLVTCSDVDRSHSL